MGCSLNRESCEDYHNKIFIRTNYVIVSQTEINDRVLRIICVGFMTDFIS